ncbi:hypothetical protein [Longimycelium tulufanense]|nr:hypothetical protein [Longimycelium tulufanense]
MRVPEFQHLRPMTPEEADDWNKRMAPLRARRVRVRLHEEWRRRTERGNRNPPNNEQEDRR